MRIRALKPGFFLNEQLAELSPWHRLCFAGLWCCADREGRLRDRPKRLKAEIFPYDDLDMNRLLWDLTHAGFIIRYQTGGHPYLYIPTWSEHQHPRNDEAQSDLPAYAAGTERPGGPDVTTYPAERPAEHLDDQVVPVTATDASLSRHAAVTAARMGNGDLETGQVVTPPPKRAAAQPCRVSDLMDLWNATTTPPLPRCRELTDGRRQKIRARLRKRPLFAEWREAFEFVATHAFYRGENDRQWVADFDWVIKNDTVIAKILERALMEVGTTGRPRGCTHSPPCPDEAAHTQRFIAEQNVT